MFARLEGVADVGNAVDAVNGDVLGLLLDFDNEVRVAAEGIPRVVIELFDSPEFRIVGYGDVVDKPAA